MKKAMRVRNMGVFALGFSIVGTGMILLSAAIASTVSIEPESSAGNGGISVISDTEASNGSSIKFSANPLSTTLLQTTFESVPVAAPISVANYRSVMGDATMTVGASNLTNTSIATEAGHGNFMRQTLPANASGGSSGIVTFPKLSQIVDEASMEYDVRFGAGFDWSYGGKLPGLGGARAGTNPGDAAGCNAVNDYSWSGRSMWITPGSYPNSSSAPNEWIGYMYNPTKANSCGDNVQSDTSFVAGQWHRIKQYYKMNTPGSNDGVHRMWIDNQLVFERTNFVYRSAADVNVSHIYWAIFRGGGSTDTNWQSNQVDTIDIDNITILAL